MFKKIQNSKTKNKGTRKKKAPVAEPVEQPSEENAASELDIPVDETSPETFDPKIDKATQTPVPEDSTSEDELPQELQMDCMPKFMHASQSKAATFVVIKREKKDDKLHFRLRADIDPDWMKRQHRIREEVALQKQRELDSVPPLVIKSHSRIDYLKSHKLRNSPAGRQQQLSATTSPKRNPERNTGSGTKFPNTSSSGSKIPIKVHQPKPKLSIAAGKHPMKTQRKLITGSKLKKDSRAVSHESRPKMSLSSNQGIKSRGVVLLHGQEIKLKQTNKSPHASRTTTPKGSPSRKGQHSKSPSHGKTDNSRGSPSLRKQQEKSKHTVVSPNLRHHKNNQVKITSGTSPRKSPSKKIPVGQHSLATSKLVQVKNGDMSAKTKRLLESKASVKKVLAVSYTKSK